MITFKMGVSLQSLQVPMLLALQQTIEFTRGNGDCLIVVTSVNDGEHMKNSLHYAGAAIDLAIPGKNILHSNLARWLSRGLTKDFDVINEGDHVHVEYQPNP